MRSSVAAFSSLLNPDARPLCVVHEEGGSQLQLNKAGTLHAGLAQFLLLEQGLTQLTPLLQPPEPHSFAVLLLSCVRCLCSAVLRASPFLGRLRG